MAISVKSNVASLNAQLHLGRTQNALAGNFARLSSGMRINTAADDAAGLGISEKLKAQIRSLAQAERNANDGISMLQTAEGAMNEMSGVLTRMRELAMQSANGTYGTTERGYLQTEYDNLMTELDRIADVTEFNGTMLLDGSNTAGIDLQVGINATTNDAITITFGDLHTDALGVSGTGTGATALSDTSIGNASGAQTALSVIDQAISDLSSQRSDLGAVQNRLNVTIANLGTARENLTAANSRIRDVDIASETAEMTKNNILLQAGVAVLAQANQVPSVALSLLQ